MTEENKAVNEMSLLEDMCAAVPPPDPQTLAAARDRVLAAARTASPPVPGRPRRAGRGGLAVSPRLAWPQLALIGTAAAVAAAGVAVGVSAHAPSGGGTPVRLDAATVLNRAARATLAGPAPGNDDFVYTDVRGVNPGHGPSWSYRQQTWLSVDGHQPGALRNTTCFPGLPARDNLPTCLAKVPAGRGGPLRVTYAWARSLPTRPATLLRFLMHHNNCTGPDVMGAHHTPYTDAFSEIYTILHALYVLPPRSGAALFRAAALIPGVTVLPQVTDAAGGQGVGVAMTGRDAPGGPLMRYELIFDPQSYRFIGLQNVSLTNGPGQIAGHVNHAESLVATRVTQTAPAGYTKIGSSITVTGGVPSCIAGP